MLRSTDWRLVKDVSAQPMGPKFKGQAVEESFPWTAGPLKMGLTGCAETSVPNRQSMLRNIPEEHRSNLHRGRSLKSWINT